jgi:hypothetical protein
MPAQRLAHVGPGRETVMKAAVWHANFQQKKDGTVKVLLKP